MREPFWKRPRPLFFSLVAMTLLCLLLLVLYGLTEKENAMLHKARNELFLSLAIDEAEAAERAWQEQRPTAELYHHITAAADYLSMTTETAQSRQMTDRLRATGNWLLSRTIADEAAADVPVSCPWQELPCISREEGKKIAEEITQTQNCLTPAAGRSYIYTCKNVYVKLSPHGGIPMEIAVYTPVRPDRPYTVADCGLRGSRFRETILPRALCCRSPTATTETPTGYRFHYPCTADWQLWLDVRGDTGRIVGWRMQAVEPKKER